MLIQKRGEYEYVAKSERDGHGEPIEGATVFVLRPYSRAVWDKIRGISDGKVETWDFWKYMLVGLKGGCVGSVAFEADKDGIATDELLAAIPAAILNEAIAAYIQDHNLSAEEVKNSE